MTREGDKNFENHKRVAELWGLLAMRFASSNLLPLNVSYTAERLEGYSAEIEAALKISPVEGNLEALTAAIATYKAEARSFMSRLTGSALNNTLLAEVSADRAAGSRERGRARK